MRSLASAALWILVGLGLWFPPADASGQTAVSEPAPLERCPGLADIIGAPRWRASLVNPVLRSASEVAETATRYRETLDCLSGIRWSSEIPEWAELVSYHLDLFLLFADSPSPDDPSREWVDFRRMSDPAVERLREELGLDPPEGLVFVRYFDSPNAMPARIRGAFRDPETRAVTLGARYIAVLAPESGAGDSRGVMADSLEATMSHEFVHAFLNARLDWSAEGRRFPSWFHEGMAIYFSNSGRRHVVLDPLGGQLLRIEPTVEYEQYERVFRFVETSLGQSAFHRVLRDAVESVEASRVPAAVGLASYEELHARAERWWRWWPVPVGWTSGPGILILTAMAGLSAAAIVRLWQRWQPAIAGSTLEVELNRDLGGAVRARDAAAVRELLKSGADPNASESGRSVLEWAVVLDDVATAEVLLQSGAVSTQGLEALAQVRSESGDMIRVLDEAALRRETDSD